MKLYIWQAVYLIGAAALLPVSPFLYLQGQYVRRRVGVLPGAAGDRRGRTSDEGGEPVKLLVIGESTVAGLGARTHRTALAGQFARFLSEKIGRPVEWFAVGKNGVTARQTIRELVPQIPAEHFDYIMLGVGGNDVLKLSSPMKWRRDMTELLGIMRQRWPEATMFMTNAPAVNLSPVLPHPIRFVLARLSELHDANSRQFTKNWERVYYFHQPKDVPSDFWADGIHPSEKGYEVWSQRMVQFFTDTYQWHIPNSHVGKLKNSSTHEPNGC